MKLKEFESKKLLNAAGITTSHGVLITTSASITPFNQEKVFKVQTLAGGRGKAGGIKVISNDREARTLANQFLGKEFLQEQITEILLDEKITIIQELYLGVMFDTSKRKPVFIFSEDGGVNIEETKRKSPPKVIVTEIDYVTGLTPQILTTITAHKQLQEIMQKLYSCFIQNDCRMLEINPLVLTPDNRYVAVDGVAVLDDDAKYRWPHQFEERTDNRKATPREYAAHQIDKNDYRGVAGKTFVDLGGDIAILTSGGGATMTLMDALVLYGGKPANFTEYSGNPPQEKVEKLTRIVLDRQGLSGLLIAGVIANFTNIYETLQGILTVLIEKKPSFPIVIRRAGPHDTEAKKAMLDAKEKFGLDIHYYGEEIALTEAVKIMIDLSSAYKQKSSPEKGNSK